MVNLWRLVADRQQSPVDQCLLDKGSHWGEALEPQKQLDRRLEEAVGGGYCWLQKPLGLALAASGTVAGYRQGALQGGGGGTGIY